MRFEDHCDECLQKLGERWPEVHRWLDAFAGEAYPLDTHRIHRHHEAGVEEVRHRWGAQAAEAAKLHILSDLAVYGVNHVPTAVEAEELWEPESPPKVIKDLGWGNGWQVTPAVVLECSAARSRLEQHEYSDRPGPWTNTHIVTCKTCGYTYQYDSGD